MPESKLTIQAKNNKKRKQAPQKDLKVIDEIDEPFIRSKPKRPKLNPSQNTTPSNRIGSKRGTSRESDPQESLTKFHAQYKPITASSFAIRNSYVHGQNKENKLFDNQNTIANI